MNDLFARYTKNCEIYPDIYPDKSIYNVFETQY